MSGSGIGVEDLADRCGALAWMADAVFGLEGRWSAVMDTAGAVEHLATHSRFHGWHATMWRDLLPDSPALGGPQRVVAPAGWEAALAVASELGDDGGEAERLALLYRGLVPRVAAAVHELESRAIGPSGTAAARVARLVAADHRSDLVGGASWLSNALSDRESVERSGSAVSSLDLAFLNL